MVIEPDIQGLGLAEALVCPDARRLAVGGDARPAAGLAPRLVRSSDLRVALESRQHGFREYSRRRDRSTQDGNDFEDAEHVPDSVRLRRTHCGQRTRVGTYVL